MILVCFFTGGSQLGLGENAAKPGELGRHQGILMGWLAAPHALCQPHEALCQGHVPGPHAPSPSNALADAGMVFCRERLHWKH